jgi:hypothetical protein
VTDARASLPAPDEGDARTILLRTSDGEVVAIDRPQGPLLVFDSHGHDLDFAMHIVAVSAILLTVLVTLIVASHAAPRPLIAFPVTWVVIAVVALRRARTHRRRFGHFEIDIARAELRHAWHERPLRTLPSRAIRFAAVETVDDPDEAARGVRIEQVQPRWLELELTDGERLRIARGRPWELRRICAALRDVGIEVR